MYHCGTAPAALHIANGMYGAIVVDPAKPRPKAREFVFVQSEFYLSKKPSSEGARTIDWERLLTLAPDHVVFNGRVDRYASRQSRCSPMSCFGCTLSTQAPTGSAPFTWSAASSIGFSRMPRIPHRWPEFKPSMCPWAVQASLTYGCASRGITRL